MDAAVVAAYASSQLTNGLAELLARAPASSESAASSAARTTSRRSPRSASLEGRFERDVAAPRARARRQRRAAARRTSSRPQSSGLAAAGGRGRLEGRQDFVNSSSGSSGSPGGDSEPPVRPADPGELRPLQPPGRARTSPRPWSRPRRSGVLVRQVLGVADVETGASRLRARPPARAPSRSAPARGRARSRRRPPRAARKAAPPVPQPTSSEALPGRTAEAATIARCMQAEIGLDALERRLRPTSRAAACFQLLECHPLYPVLGASILTT